MYADSELITLCAEVMELKLETLDGAQFLTESVKNGIPTIYDPLRNDAQAMALIRWLRKKVRLSIHDDRLVAYVLPSSKLPSFNWYGKDLNRAICECVAVIYQVKKS